MDQRLRDLEQRVRNDPADAEAIRSLVALYDRAGRRFEGRSIAGWVALLEDPDLTKRALEALTVLGPLALPAAPRAAAIEKAGGLVWFEAQQLLDAIGSAAAPDLVAVFLDEDFAEYPGIFDRIGRYGPAAAAVAPDLLALRSRCQGELRISLERAIWRLTGDPEPALALAQTMAREADAATTGPLLRLLRELGPAARPLVPWLISGLGVDSPLARDLADTLVAIAPDDPRVVERFARLLDHPSRGQAQFAAQALARLGAPARSVLCDALEHARLKRREPLVRALADIGLDDRSALLIHSQLSDRRRSLKIAAAAALGPERGGAEALEVLIRGLSDEEKLARRAAIGLRAYRRRERSIIGPLIKASCEGSAELRVECLLSLIAVARNPAAVARRYLKAWSRHPNRFFENSSRFALVGDAGQAWTSAFEACLEDKDTWVSFAAALDLHALGAPSSPPLRAAVLRGLSADGLTRGAAVTIVEARAPDFEDAAPALVAILEDPGFGDRSLIYKALASIGPASAPALPILESRLRDPLDGFAIAAAILAIRGPHPEALDVLIQGLDDVDRFAPILACEALAAAGAASAAALEALRELASRPTEDRDARRAAGAAILDICAAIDREELRNGPAHPSA